MSVSLTMTESQHAGLVAHLFPPDGNEAVAIALCGRADGTERHRLIVRKVDLVPYEACSVRRPDCVTWSTDFLVSLLEEASRQNLAVVKLHGHTGYDRFSEVDNQSDRALFPSIYAWTDTSKPHGSVILMRDGRIFGRAVTEEGSFTDFTHTTVVGDSITRYGANASSAHIPEFGRRVAQTFGAGTFQQLRKLKIGIVGCSGTGSIVVEQLARNCVGELVLVDPDHVEDKNLNRILNATAEDARNRLNKTHLAQRAIEAMGLGTKVKAFPGNLFDVAVVRELASCDVLFGCMDTVDGRFLLNKLATFYAIPYLDLGVKIEADGRGGVDQVCGTVHYLKPGGSSLLSRHTFTMEQVRAAGLKRTDPKHYAALLQQGYIRGVGEDRPAVIQLNALIASYAVNELLARLHPYRSEPNGDFAVTRVSLSHGFVDYEGDGDACPVLARHVGRGDVNPLLDWAELS